MVVVIGAASPEDPAYIVSMVQLYWGQAGKYPVSLLGLSYNGATQQFALSTTNPMTWQAIRESLADSLRRSNPAASLGEQNDLTEMPHITVSLGADLTYLGAVLESKAASVPLLQAGDIIRRHDRLVVSLPTDLLFQPASAELEPAAIPASLRAPVPTVHVNLLERVPYRFHR